MKRLQRLRSTQHLRNLCAETEFTTSQLIQPLFAVEGLNQNEPIMGLQAVYRQPVGLLLKQIESDLESGVSHFLLFNVSQQKALKGFNHTYSHSVISEIKKQFGKSLHLWVDTCLCSLTTHGHCCVFDDGHKLNHDQTLTELSGLALNSVQAGADGISPSDMMDGRVAKIRATLDDALFSQIPIMSYSKKFASNFYGP